MDGDVITTNILLRLGEIIWHVIHINPLESSLQILKIKCKFMYPPYNYPKTMEEQTQQDYIPTFLFNIKGVHM